ncbi:MAG TPA: hypothetical protein VLJ15_07425 [Gammaproteobacteria bacterium]|nr:hypothetical protein [Gammaproteobacteria bacterium]
MSRTQYTVCSFLSVTLIFLLAIFVQNKMLMNCDASWFVYGARRVLLEGGSYLNNYTEINPPLILYLSWPVAFFSHTFHLGESTVFSVYIFLLSMISLAACCFLIQKIFSRHLFNGWLCMALTAFCMMVLPLGDFGQREHLMIILTFPWFFSMALRLEKGSIHSGAAFLTGFFAGIGFLIKPYFLISFAFVEIYYVWRNKNVTACIRADTLAMLLAGLIYVSIIVFRHPDYLAVMFPLLSHAYFALFDYQWSEVLLTKGLLFYCMAVILYFIQNKQYPYQTVSTVFFLASTGFFLSYLIHRTPFYYHLYPVFLPAMLVILLAFSSFFYANPFKAGKALFFWFLASFLFVFSFDYVDDNYQYGIFYADGFKKLITFMKQTVETKKVYFLTTNGDHVFPMVTDAGVNYFSKLYGLICMFDMNKQTSLKLGLPLSKESNQNETFFLNIILSEIKTEKPEFVFVDTRDEKTFFRMVPLNFVNYFSRYAGFREEWQHYHYLTTIDSPDLYRYAVYQRV